MRQQNSRTVIVGNYEHKSLNEGSRKAEFRRIQMENYKLLLQMNATRPAEML
jgi:hypothetical protein